MPIYEYYCPDNHTIYQFYAKTLAQGKTTPKCPDNPLFKMEKMVSNFAVTSGGKTSDDAPPASDLGSPGGMDDDPKMEAAMNAMEREFSNIDENDPRAMGRMMRRMSEITGEKLDGEMEEVVRKLEEGADPDSLEEQFGAGEEPGMDDPYGGPSESAGGPEPKEKKQRFKIPRAQARRDPKLYDYE
jgi:hypothetical protein